MQMVGFFGKLFGFTRKNVKIGQKNCVLEDKFTNFKVFSKKINNVCLKFRELFFVDVYIF